MACCFDAYQPQCCSQAAVGVIENPNSDLMKSENARTLSPVSQRLGCSDCLVLNEVYQTTVRDSISFISRGLENIRTHQAVIERRLMELDVANVPFMERPHTDTAEKRMMNITPRLRQFIFPYFRDKTLLDSSDYRTQTRFEQLESEELKLMRQRFPFDPLAVDSWRILADYALRWNGIRAAVDDYLNENGRESIDHCVDSGNCDWAQLTEAVNSIAKRVCPFSTMSIQQKLTLDRDNRVGVWTRSEIAELNQLMDATEKNGSKLFPVDQSLQWDMIGQRCSPPRLGIDLMMQINKMRQANRCNRIIWDPEEDAALKSLVESCRFGDYISWDTIADLLDTNRQSSVVENHWKLIARIEAKKPVVRNAVMHKPLLDPYRPRHTRLHWTDCMNQTLLDAVQSFQVESANGRLPMGSWGKIAAAMPFKIAWHKCYLRWQKIKNSRKDSKSRSFAWTAGQKRALVKAVKRAGLQKTNACWKLTYGHSWERISDSISGRIHGPRGCYLQWKKHFRDRICRGAAITDRSASESMSDGDSNISSSRSSISECGTTLSKETCARRTSLRNKTRRSKFTALRRQSRLDVNKVSSYSLLRECSVVLERIPSDAANLIVCSSNGNHEGPVVANFIDATDVPTISCLGNHQQLDNSVETHEQIENSIREILVILETKSKLDSGDVSNTSKLVDRLRFRPRCSSLAGVLNHSVSSDELLQTRCLPGNILCSHDGTSNHAHCQYCGKLINPEKSAHLASSTNEVCEDNLLSEFVSKRCVRQTFPLPPSSSTLVMLGRLFNDLPSEEQIGIKYGSESLLSSHASTKHCQSGVKAFGPTTDGTTTDYVDFDWYRRLNNSNLLKLKLTLRKFLFWSMVLALFDRD